MTKLDDIYRTPLGLLTDLYQLTMAFGYWKSGRADLQSVFHLTFRKHPFGGQFAIASGLSHVIDLLSELRFESDDIGYLSSFHGADGRRLFDPEFLDYLAAMQFICDVDAVEEGTAVFAHEPLVRVNGPLLQAQIVETALLNIINFQTLIATKSARVCKAAAGDPVLEFGLRRAQGVDGGLAASRAAYIGGCAATSNVLAGKLFDIPVKGTHAHSWVMSFDDELESFKAYAAAMPNNCVFLVDTYDTVEGVRKAVEVGKKLREQGHEMLGIRLDSGDLAALSKQARVIMDAAGFEDAAVVASNDLDEHSIEQLKQEGSQINMWGIGTKLATAYDHAALGGVYKLSALHDGSVWQPKIKLSNDPIKVSTPGQLQIRRFTRDDGSFHRDMIFDELTHGCETRQESQPVGGENPNHVDLLVPIFRGGQRVYTSPTIHEMRARTSTQLSKLDDAVIRLDQPREYGVELEPTLRATKERLWKAAGGNHQ